jgi:ProP effector
MKRESKSDKPLVIVRRKVGKGGAPTGPTQAIPKTASPVKVTKPASPVQPPQQVQQPVPLQASAPPAVTEAGPNRKERERQARRELLDVLRDRWPQVFPIDFQQVKPLALGIKRDIAAHLPQHSLLRIGGAIGVFQRLMGPAYYRAILRGGPRYDLDGNPRGEVTPEEQEQAKRDLAAFYERRKKRAASSTPHPRRENSAEGLDGAGKGD